MALVGFFSQSKVAIAGVVIRALGGLAKLAPIVAKGALKIAKPLAKQAINEG